MVKLFMDKLGGMVYKVELAEEGDILKEHLASQSNHEFEKLSEDRGEPEPVAAESNDSKPKRRSLAPSR